MRDPHNQLMKAENVYTDFCIFLIYEGYLSMLEEPGTMGRLFLWSKAKYQIQCDKINGMRDFPAGGRIIKIIPGL